MAGRVLSDAPLIVDDVAIKPTWQWSPEYRDHVAAQARAVGRSDLSPAETQRRYIEWYADKHDLSFAAAEQKVLVAA